MESDKTKTKIIPATKGATGNLAQYSPAIEIFINMSAALFKK
jgi:hypothetical protein